MLTEQQSGKDSPIRS